MLFVLITLYFELAHSFEKKFLKKPIFYRSISTGCFLT